MKSQSQHWRPVRHPLALTTRKGWRWGRGCLVSPRGTIFEVRLRHFGALARRRFDFQLNEPGTNHE